MQTNLKVKPVVRLLRTKLTLDGCKANFAINLWFTVQQYMNQLPSVSRVQVTADDTESILKISRSEFVVTQAKSCQNTDLHLSSNLKFSLYSLQAHNTK